MASFIILPSLHLSPLTAQTIVSVFHAGQTLSSAFDSALEQFPKAIVALHPADAPLHIVELPPLPANRRDAALRVTLEDSLLGDTSQLTLAVARTTKHIFWVNCVATALLNKVLNTLESLGHASRPVTALASRLRDDSEHSLNGWTLWRDARGAGASPHDSVSSPPPFLTSLDLNELSPHFYATFNAPPTKDALWLRWRWAALLATLCAIVYLTGLSLHSRQLLALEAQINRSILSTFQATLPNVPMVDAVLQLQRAASGSSPLSTALNHIPNDWPPAMITQLSWQKQRLSITVTPTILKLSDAQQQIFTDTLASKNIAVTWSKP